MGFRWWKGPIVDYFYVMITMNRGKAREMLADPAIPESVKASLQKYVDFFLKYPYSDGHTHSIPNYERMIASGIDGTERRIAKAAENFRFDPEREGYFEALRRVNEAMRGMVQRVLEYLQGLHFDEPAGEANRITLIDGYRTVLTGGVRTFEQAMIAANFWFYVDGSDGYGRFDQFMYPYYRYSRRTSGLSDDRVVEWLEEAWYNIDRTNGFQVALGGSKTDGKHSYNRLSALAIKAARGKRRPNMALRVRKDMPQAIWDAAFDCIVSGNGLPALYNEEGYLAALENAHLNLSGADLKKFAFGGCTETMVHGCSNVGSLDHCVHSIKLLENAVREELAGADSFESFLAIYKKRLRDDIERVAGEVSHFQKKKAIYHPQLIRSILIDDCIDSGIEYAAGGARYNWSVINIVGMTNVVDSLIALKKTVFGGGMTADRMLRLLETDFAEAPEERHKLLALPKFGNGDPETDELANDLSAFVNDEFGRYAPWRGGRFLTACIMFATYVDFGRNVGATPDGRPSSAAVADSAGAYQGRDKHGPTALFASVGHLNGIGAPGTNVVNIRFSKKLMTGRDSREKVKALIRSYFELGGMQLQINVVDQATLRAAIKNPEDFRSLVVRLGGYSEYFRNLSPEMKQTILDRTVHEI
jgi:formate C-acetyltransferase